MRERSIAMYHGFALVSSVLVRNPWLGVSVGQAAFVREHTLDNDIEELADLPVTITALLHYDEHGQLLPDYIGVKFAGETKEYYYRRNEIYLLDQRGTCIIYYSFKKNNYRQANLIDVRFMKVETI